MTEVRAAGGFDRDAVRAKYREERDKRLWEGRAAIRDLSRDEVFSEYRRDPFTPYVEREPLKVDTEIAIVGAGIAGVVVGAQLRKAGIERIRLVDQAGGVGGTWYWNRYPGLMCDVESYIYLPMLEDMGYIPKTRYAFGDEIRRHLEAIARKYDLLDDALFHTGATRTEWDEDAAQWVIHTDRGDEIRAHHVVMAVGILNLMKLPAIPGMEDFTGKAFHSARWDYEYTGGDQEGSLTDTNLTKLGDKTVAIMGAGGSAIQIVPHLARCAEQVYVFQRTPSAVGVRGNRPTSDDFDDDFEPGWQRARMENFQAVMSGMPVDADLIDDGWTHNYAKVLAPKFEPGQTLEEGMAALEEFDFGVMEEHRVRIDEIVRDPEKAAVLKPYYRYLCKRPLFHDEYLDAFNAPNVTLIDCPEGIERVTERGIVVSGHDYEVDCIIYATGFEAEMTPLPRRVGHEIVGRDGVTIAEKFADGMATLHGTMTRGFPNMFFMPCPGQHSAITVNHTLIATEIAEHVAQVVEQLEARGVRVADVSAAAETEWTDLVTGGAAMGAAGDLFEACTPSRINNEGGAVSGVPGVGGHPGGFFGFQQAIADWRDQGMPGLELDEPYTGAST